MCDPWMTSFSHSFLGSGPKGPMSCRTQGGISRRPSIHPSIRPSVHPSVCPSLRPSILLSIPPGWPMRPHILTLRPDLGPLSPQISPPGLKSALQTSNQLSRPQISSKISYPGLKSALQPKNQHSRPQISPPGLQSAPNALSLPLDLISNLQA